MTEIESGKMKVKFFGEYAYYEEGNAEDKQKAYDYLEFWKRNLLFKLEKDSFKPVIIPNGEQWNERDSLIMGLSSQHAALSLKLCISLDFNYELK